MNLLTKYRQSPQLQWIVRHTVFWVLFQPFIVYQTYFYGFTSDLNVKIAFQWLPFTIFMVYVFLYSILPCLLKELIKQFLFRAVIWLVALFTGIYFIHFYILLPLNNGKSIGSPIDISDSITFTTVKCIMLLCQTCIASSLKLFRYWYRKENNNQQLAKETMVAELQLLKAQVHPHFLFNTLNNLYSLTLKKSPRSPEVVVKLSELLHYMMHECNASEVPVQKEVRMIENYIELEKLRYGNRLNVELTISGEIEGANIAPLLLIPFVENAFKHGSSEQAGDAFILISLFADSNVLSFKIKNSRNEPESVAAYGGIGLVNVKKRLALIYPGKYQLIVLPENNTYEVGLVINHLKN
jgi:LytS/YehU family sensor histidine kinase